ncbi:MAG TPA: phosphoribosylanthranilate isomerase [Polyangiaceae bacterium]|nr:phosphoribosylanthranilate isomerase [Polyangiaceae bacterium]
MYVKICGVTGVEDAELVCAAGASALGVNLVAGSPRRVEPEQARAIVAAVAGRLETVAVVRALPAGELRALRAALGVDWVQIHDDVDPAVVERVPGAFVAVRIGDAADVARARRAPGPRVLVDAKVAGALGGTGQAFDWSLVADLARARAIVLAGGLHPGNVARAVAAVAPWGVDVASGVERTGDPRRKDPARIAAFVAAARGGSV